MALQRVSTLIVVISRHHCYELCRIQFRQAGSCIFVSALLFVVFLSLFIPLVDRRMAVVKSSLFSNDFLSFVDILLSLQLYL